MEEYWLFKHCIQREMLLCPICNSGDVYMTRCQEYAQKCDTLHEISELIVFGDCATHLVTSVVTFLAHSEYQMSLYYLTIWLLSVARQLSATYSVLERGQAGESFNKA